MFLFHFYRVEKQRAALQEKLKEQQQKTEATSIKERMEEQLKQQRAAMQQKRLLGVEGQPKVVTTTTSNILSAVMSAAPLTSTAGLKGLSTLAPNTLLKTSGGVTTLLSTGGVIKKITQVQPRTTAPGNFALFRTS